MEEQAQAAEQKPEPEKTVKIRRRPKQPIATCISYPDGDRYDYWRPAAEENEFEVTETIAQAAVASGYFTRTRKPQAITGEAPADNEEQAKE